MGYIIVWRNSHRDPHLGTDWHDFKEEYSSFDDAKKAAIEIEENENSGKEKSPWYFDYAIYEEVTS